MPFVRLMSGTIIKHHPLFTLFKNHQNHMKKTTTIIALLCAFAASATAQTALPYRTGFDSPAETAGWQLFQRGATGTLASKWEYTIGAPYSPTQCLVHLYPVVA